jgi:hypothetical protein
LYLCNLHTHDFSIQLQQRILMPLKWILILIIDKVIFLKFLYPLNSIFWESISWYDTFFGAEVQQLFTKVGSIGTSRRIFAKSFVDQRTTI